MVSNKAGRTWAAAILLSIAFASTARADARDYAFQLVDEQVKSGGGAEVTARLVHKPSGTTVPDAIVFERRIDMSPDGMGQMSAPLDPVSDMLPGYHRFETDLLMPGRWALSLRAMVPGEGIVQSRLILKAVP